MAMPIALVTGASGFTGEYVVRAFQNAGYEVIAWSRGEAGTCEVDLCDLASVKAALASVGPDVVVHLAAVSFVGHLDVNEIYQVNIVGTRNLLQSLSTQAKRPARVLLAGSANIYGSTEGIIREDSEPNPQNDYAVSKMAMEYMAKLWSEHFPITVVRPFNYTGVGQSERFVVPKIVEHFRRGAPTLELGNIDVFRDFNDVRNVAHAYLALAELPGPNWEVLNICTGLGFSLREIIGKLEAFTGHTPEITVNPSFVRANEVTRLVGDPSALRSRLGTLPEFSMDALLQWMMDGKTGNR